MRYWMLSVCMLAVFAFGFAPSASASEYRGEKSIAAHGYGGGWGHRGGGRGWGHGGGRGWGHGGGRGWGHGGGCGGW